MYKAWFMKSKRNAFRLFLYLDNNPKSDYNNRKSDFGLFERLYYEIENVERKIKRIWQR